MCLCSKQKPGQLPLGVLATWWRLRGNCMVAFSTAVTPEGSCASPVVMSAKHQLCYLQPPEFIADERHGRATHGPPGQAQLSVEFAVHLHT